MMNKKIYITLIISIIGGITVLWFIQSPRYSLLRVRSSIISKDSITFNKYVAVNEVSESIIDDMIEHGFTGGKPKGWLAQIAVSFIKGIAGLAKPALTEEAQKSLRSWFQGESSDFTAILDIISKPKNVKLKNIAWVNKFGPDAEVGLVFVKPQTGETFMLEIKMRDMGNFWQIYDIKNYFAFLRWAGYWNNK